MELLKSGMFAIILFAILLVLIYVVYKRISRSNNVNDEDIIQLPLFVLCFLFPIIGIIMYCVNVNKNKKYANTCLLVGCSSFIIIFVLTLLFVLIA